MASSHELSPGSAPKNQGALRFGLCHLGIYKLLLLLLTTAILLSGKISAIFLSLLIMLIYIRQKQKQKQNSLEENISTVNFESSQATKGKYVCFPKFSYL